MRTTIRNRREEDITIHITRELLLASVPGDKNHCTVAKGMQEQYDIFPEIAYDFTTGEDIVVWQQTEDNRPRNYSGILEPNKLATQIVMGTDIDVKKLARLCPEEGWYLTVTRGESRFKQRTAANPAPIRIRGTSTRRKPRRVMARVVPKT